MIGGGRWVYLVHPSLLVQKTGILKFFIKKIEKKRGIGGHKGIIRNASAWGCWRLRHERITISKNQFICGLCDKKSDWYNFFDEGERPPGSRPDEGSTTRPQPSPTSPHKLAIQLPLPLSPSPVCLSFRRGRKE